jgi:hypothetical protein
MGEKHWSARCAHSGKGALPVSHQKHCYSRQRDPGPKREGQGRRKGRECCSSTAGQAPGPRHSRTRASGKRSLSPSLKQLQHAAKTRGDKPVSQLRRCLRRAALCQCCQCVQDSSSFDGGGSRCMAPAQPHHVPLPSHALSLLAKTTFACNVVEAQVVPAHSSRRPSHRPFPSCYFMLSRLFGNLCSSYPRHCPGPHPSPQPST